MPRTGWIHDVDDDAYDALAQHAAELGLSVPELLRKEAERLAARPTLDDWIGRTHRRPGSRAKRDTLEALDELRGAWPSSSTSTPPASSRS